MNREKLQKKRRAGFARKMGLLFSLVGVLFFLFWMNNSISSKDVSALEKPLPQPTVIYDRHGKAASKIASSKIEGVDYKDISEHLVHAVVATEDKRFYDHAGIDIEGVFRAMYRNAKAGGVVEGGSTITQQLTKNVFLTREKTFRRKWDELILAKKVEQNYTKEEIMEMYLNRIYFGEGAWGIKRAAKVYFGKEPAKLTLGESAMIAGLIKAPSALTPLKHYDKALERQRTVLKLMKDQGYITAAEWEKAKLEKVVLNPGETDPYEGKYPYYVDHVIEEAIKEYGLSQNEIMSGGFRIYTALDQTMQKNAEAVFQNDELFPAGTDQQMVQSGMVLVNPKNGGVRALVGGRGEHTFRGFNRATQLKRQPGSTMKPLAVYAPALEDGYSVVSPLKDEYTDYGGYRPTNYDGQYRGRVTMYEAVIKSYNAPAVWLLNEMGIDRGLQSLKKFGIPLVKEDRTLGVALGGLHEGVSPLDMAEAYSAFPNNGAKHEAHAIREIRDAENKVIYKWDKKASEAVTKSAARKMTLILKGTVEEGTGRKAKIAGRELAAKTGSTQVPIKGIDGVKDQWFVGYTPDLVGSVWVGYDKTDSTHYLKTASSSTAAVIFKDIMEGALEGTEASSFGLPPLAMPKASQNAGSVEAQRKADSHNSHRVKDNGEKKKDKEKDKEKGKGRGKEKHKEKHGD